MIIARTLAIIAMALALASTADAGFLDKLMKGSTAEPTVENDDANVVDGLKEALSIGTKNAVGNVSKTDGYFGNPDIKILFPDKIRKVADVLSTVGYRQQVDDFVLSMNRAAEKAAPKATEIFLDSIRQMTFDDARGILSGGDTAATDYFEEKTSDKLYDAFKPTVSASMDEVGVTRRYKDLIGRYESVPFVSSQSLDLDHYVTEEALGGLFFVLAEEEKKIRTEPSARVTELLKKVFGP